MMMKMDAASNAEMHQHQHHFGNMHFAHASSIAISNVSDNSPPDSPTESNLSFDPPTIFTEQEDEMLRELVKRHGTKKWHIISAKMHNKTPRECRRRWRTYLHMCMNKSSWSAEEDRLLLEGHNAYGNRWTEIAKMACKCNVLTQEVSTIYNRRTDNAVKNRFNALCKKRSHRPKAAGHLLEVIDHENSDEIEYSKELKRPKRLTDLSSDREDAYGSFLPCVKQNLSIGIPDNDLIYMSASTRQLGVFTSSDVAHEMLQRELECSSPRDVAIDMEEVMGWLITRTPTPTTCNGSVNSTVTSSTTTSPSQPTENDPNNREQDTRHGSCFSEEINLHSDEFGGLAFEFTSPHEDVHSHHSVFGDGQLTVKDVEELVLILTADGSRQQAWNHHSVDQQLQQYAHKQ